MFHYPATEAYHPTDGTTKVCWSVEEYDAALKKGYLEAKPEAPKEEEPVKRGPGRPPKTEAVKE